MYPWPLIQTDALLSRDTFAIPDLQLRSNISVVACTKFVLHHAAAEPGQPSAPACLLRAVHVASKLPRAPTSRVRVDSLALQASSPSVCAS